MKAKLLLFQLFYLIFFVQGCKKDETTSPSESFSNVTIQAIDAKTSAPIIGATVGLVDQYQNQQRRFSGTTNSQGKAIFNNIYTSLKCELIIYQASSSSLYDYDEVVDLSNYNNKIFGVNLTNGSQSGETTHTYVIDIAAGGGQYTNTVISINMSLVPTKIIGTGKSDVAYDGVPRTAISKSYPTSNWYDFNGKSNIDISSYAATKFYLLLNSKYGIEKDSYITLEVTTSSIATITWNNVTGYTDDIDYVDIYEK